MPKTKDGWTLDDTPDFTDEQWSKIQALIAEGKSEEAQKLIEEIMAKNEQDDR